MICNSSTAAWAVLAQLVLLAVGHAHAMPIQQSLERASERVEEMNQSPEDQGPQRAIGYPNLKARTFGGSQFWTDLRNVSDWRIQVNSETGHHRLIDPKNVRNGWGNLLHCHQLLDQKIVEGTVPLRQGKVVILLHGLMRTRTSMQPLANDLRDRFGYAVVNFQYASTRKKVGDHAAALKALIAGLGPNVNEIYLVGHSLGNLVVRRYLGDNQDPATGQQGDSRIKRMVMIGPPNQGSKMARVLKASFLFQTIAGASGSELSRSWEKLEPTLATPKFEFGIIAGGQESEQNLSNYILKGKDDFTVSVEEAKLVGARDFLVRPLFHSTMMRQPEVFKAVAEFFEHGHFVSDQARHPIVSFKSPSSMDRGQRVE